MEKNCFGGYQSNTDNMIYTGKHRLLGTKSSLLG